MWLSHAQSSHWPDVITLDSQSPAARTGRAQQRRSTEGEPLEPVLYAYAVGGRLKTAEGHGLVCPEALAALAGDEQKTAASPVRSDGE